MIQHEDPVVFESHLNDSLPSSNSSSTVAKGKLMSYNESVQDNTDNDETDGKIRMFTFIRKRTPLHVSTPLPSKDANIKPQSSPVAKAIVLLEI
ncbi:uncharacterized protein PHALS_14677 [Plasmopara halstedii]|uniref:Uncharacterized protein n=1 Tax=Plasmopara halstedii TaxID=4781 RepID=A0A0N7L613_PLAHL|nr:uncharacterized protein PHALS_14677 [Plasmopara halstedii]CEG42995.1 hypothetical protein PHALS_14677 [Plasmopara halstedii]|eukprot:XP_024579364.1 hypothetical protein PHALS_14677 [Plasmopara halstedii]